MVRPLARSPRGAQSSSESSSMRAQHQQLLHHRQQQQPHTGHLQPPHPASLPLQQQPLQHLQPQQHLQPPQHLQPHLQHHVAQLGEQTPQPLLQQHHHQLQQQQHMRQQAAVTGAGRHLSGASGGGGGGLLVHAAAEAAAGATAAAGSAAAAAAVQQQQQDREAVCQLLLDLCVLEKREAALGDLSKRREQVPDLAPLLWHSFGTIAAILQEIISIYPCLSPPTLTAPASNRVCNSLALLQCVAAHPETRQAFLNAHIPLFLYPFLNTVAKTRPLEYLRLTSLGVIGALVKVDDAEVINFLLQTEIIPLCLRIMETGSELSKTVATFIVQKILLDDVGLSYICATAERFYAVSTVLCNMVTALVDHPSARLLKHVIRCYLRLADNNRAREALRQCLPDPLKDGTFVTSLQGEPLTRKWLLQLLQTVAGGGGAAAGTGVGEMQQQQQQHAAAAAVAAAAAAAAAHQQLQQQQELLQHHQQLLQQQEQQQLLLVQQQQQHHPPHVHVHHPHHHALQQQQQQPAHHHLSLQQQQLPGGGPHAPAPHHHHPEHTPLPPPHVQLQHLQQQQQHLLPHPPSHHHLHSQAQQHHLLHPQQHLQQQHLQQQQLQQQQLQQQQLQQQQEQQRLQQELLPPAAAAVVGRGLAGPGPPLQHHLRPQQQPMHSSSSNLQQPTPLLLSRGAGVLMPPPST